MELRTRTRRARTRIASLPPVLTANPYQRLLYEHLAPLGLRLEPRARLKLGYLVRRRREVRVLHFHWPQDLYRCDRGPQALRAPLSWIRLCVFAARLAAARGLGYRLVWTVHQVDPHESPSRRLDRAAAHVLARAAHRLLVHDRATQESVRRALRVGDARTAVVPHASYVGVYPPGRPRDVVRAELGLPLDSFVFLCFGHIRAYKDLDVLLAAFGSVRRKDVALVIAGASINGEAAAAAAAAADSRITTLLEFVPDESVAELFGACDAAVFPRGDGGTSGAIVLALSLGVPVVAARRPAYEELLGGDRGWLFEPEDSASLARVLESAADAPEAARARGRNALALARARSWPEVARQTAEAMSGGGVDVLLVCSSGGHLLQLRALTDAWSGYSTAWVTDDATDTRSLLRDERVFFVHGPVARNVRNLARNLPLAWRLLRRLRPRVIITTGAATAVPFAWLAPLLRIDVVYIESITRIESPSLSCRLIRPVARRVYAQWPDLARSLRGAIYAGAVFGER